MGKVFVFLADGFEEIEGLTVVDILRRGGVDTMTVSVTDTRTVVGSHGIGVEADGMFSQTDFEEAEAIVLPGGMPGTLHLGAHEGLCDLVCKADKAGKWICAICAAPSILGDLGLTEGKDVTSYPGFEARLKGGRYLTDQVVVSDHMITSRGMGTALAFALMILEKLTGCENAEKIAKSVLAK